MADLQYTVEISYLLTRLLHGTKMWRPWIPIRRRC